MKHISDIDLQRMLDNELSEEQANIIIEHLSHCRECNEKYQELISLDRLLNTYPDIKPAASFTDNTMAQLHEKPSHGFIWRFAYAAAAVILTVISFYAGIHMYNDYYTAQNENNSSNEFFASSTFSNYSDNSLSSVILDINK